jgi:hypothetical protein
MELYYRCSQENITFLVFIEYQVGVQKTQALEGFRHKALRIVEKVLG